VNSKVGSPWGTSEDEGIRRWSRASKNSRNACRSSSTVKEPALRCPPGW